ncbi:hypothetical protein HRI_001990600 [Hibiscus trionum]|uniref:Uncharacterized protein n=1 Tax=Hibiscus trionum TaxID=183268 RepID=A0A9W7HUY8_HIBTR|nr:hypothetical protein HRI_001990600 [Hibiscus trionum]
MEMEDGSSTKQGSPFYYPTSFHEVVRAVLSCLGFHQNPISSSNKADHNQHAPPEEGSVIDPPPDPPSTTARGGGGVPVISFSTPKRPGTGGGRGPQIN